MMQLTWSCLCLRSCGENYLEVLMGLVQLTNWGCVKWRCGARKII